MNEKIEFDIIVNGKKAKRELDSVEKKTKQYGKSVSETASSIKSSWIAIGASVASVGYSFKKVLDIAREIDTMNIKLTEASGASILAKDKFEELLKTANEMGISVRTLAESYSKFKIASDLAGTSNKDTEKIFKSVATAASAMKLSAEDTKGAFRALEQMMSKGNVQAEELRGQLGERLPGAFALAAQAMNITQVELNSMLDRGEVLASELLPKLADVLEKQFAEGAVRAADSVQASFNRMENVMTKFKITIAGISEDSGLTKWFAEFTKGLDSIISKINVIFGKVEDLSDLERLKREAALRMQIARTIEHQNEILLNGRSLLDKLSFTTIESLEKEKKLLEAKLGLIQTVKITENKEREIALNNQAAEALEKQNEEYRKLVEAELEKIYADELLAMGLDAQGEELENVNDHLKNAYGLYSVASGAAEDYATSIDNITDALVNNEKVTKGSSNYYTTTTRLETPQDYADYGFALPEDYYTNPDYQVGYASGGYTGDVATSTIAGVVHGQEYVVNAQTTKDLGLNGSGGIFDEMNQKLSMLYDVQKSLTKMLRETKENKAYLERIATA